MVKYLVGKKTYLMAALVVLTVLVLVATGKMTPESAMAVALVAISGFAATLRAAFQRHSDEVLNVLDEIAIAGAAYTRHDLPDALKMGEAAAAGSVKVVAEIVNEETGTEAKSV